MRFSRIFALTSLCAALAISATAQQHDREAARDDAEVAALQQNTSPRSTVESDIAAVSGAPSTTASKPADVAATTTAATTAGAATTDSAAPTTAAGVEAPTLRQRPAGERLILAPEGTALRITLKKQISTVDAAPGQSFEAVVNEDVKIDGRTLIAAGAVLNGRIAHLAEPRRIAGRPWIELQAENVQLADGRTVSLRAMAVDTAEPKRYAVDDEGRIKGPTFNKAEKITGTALAGAGAVAGTIIAGAEGGLVGVGAAAGYTAGKWLITRHSMTLPESLVIILELSEPIREPQTLAEVVRQ